MDERELRLLFHSTFDRVPPLRDPFRRVREADDRPLPRWRYLALGGLAACVVLLSVAALLALRDLNSQPAGLEAAQPVTAPNAYAPAPATVAQTGSVVSESPTPRVAALSSTVTLVSVGDSILRISDGGRTWITGYAGRSDHAGNVRDLEWVSRDVAFATTNYGLLRTDDAGASWRLVNARTDLRRLDFVSGSEGYVVVGTDAQGSDSSLLLTTDGGATFTAYRVGLQPVTWIQWVSDSNAWAAGPRGVVATTDGGEHWQSQLTFRSGLFRDGQVGFVDADHGFAYFHGAATASRSSVYHTSYHTSDGGQHWQALGAPDTLSGFRDDQLTVTGPSSAEVVTRSAAGGMVRCMLPEAAESWKCLPLELGAQAGAREAATGSHRLLAAPSGDHVLIAGSADAGATWWTVEVDAAAWSHR